MGTRYELLWFIKDACTVLPEGWDLNVNFTFGDMDVALTDPDGEEVEIHSPVEHPGDAGYLQDAINTARAKAGLAHFYHGSLMDRRTINEMH